MDTIVSRALAKWPNVPAVYGWLALDRRGQWAMKRSEEGALQPLTNTRLIDFICRNYGPDELGRWCFQNGPQRVYAALDYTPLVHRISGTEPLSFETHTRLACERLLAVYMDDEGNLLLVSEHGPGVLLDRDLPRALEALVYSDGRTLEDDSLLALVEARDATLAVYFKLATATLPLQRIASQDAPRRLGYVRAPQPEQARPDLR